MGEGGVTRRGLVKLAWWFALLNGAFFSLIGLRYAAYMSDLNELPALAYLALAHWSHFTLLAGAALGLPLTFLAVAFPRERFFKALALLIASAASLLLFADTAVYAAYRFHLRGFVIDFFLEPSAGDVFNFSLMTKLYAAALVLALAAAQWGLLRLAEKIAARAAKPRLGVGIIAAFLAAFLASQAAHALADAWYYAPITALTRHLPLYQPVTAKRFLARHGIANLDANRKEFQAKWRGRSGGIKYPTQPLEFAEPQVKRNILYLGIECWRADLFSPEVTPNLWKFSRRPGVERYLNHFSGGNSTNPGVFSLFYSLPGNYYKPFGDAQLGPVLIDRLQKLNYQFGVFASAQITSTSLDRTVFAGIDNLRLSTDAPTIWQRDAKAVSEWIDWLDRRDKARPYYGFIFLYSPHAYEVPPDYPQVFAPRAKAMNYLETDRDAHKEEIFNLFKTAMHYADAQAGRIIDDLARRGELDDTVIVVTSDHAEEFNDNGKGYWGHVGNYSPAQTHVGMLLARPGGAGGGDVARRTSHLDLTATIMSDYLGCLSDPLTYSAGKGLAESTAAEGIIIASYFDYAFVTPDLIYVFDPDGATTVMDQKMNEVRGAGVPPEVGGRVLKDLSRFYR